VNKNEITKELKMEQATMKEWLNDKADARNAEEATIDRTTTVGTRNLYVELRDALDLFTAEPMVIKFRDLDGFGDVELITLEDKATGKVFYDFDDEGDWTEVDSYVTEVLHEWFFEIA